MSRDRSDRPSRKWPLLVLALVAVIAVVAIVIFSLISSNSKSPSSANTAERQFNEFATYLLYGESRPELSGEYERWTSYKLDQNLTSDADGDYWSKSIGLLNNLIDSYNDKDDETSKLIQSTLQAYRSDLIFVDEIRQLEEPTAEDIINIYLTSGQKTAEARISNIYSDLSEPLPYQGQNYVDYKKAAYAALVKRTEKYQTAGCIVDHKIVESCPNLDSFAAYEDTKEYDNNNESAKKTFNLITSNLASRCWTISNLIKDPPEASSEVENTNNSEENKGENS